MFSNKTQKTFHLLVLITTIGILLPSTVSQGPGDCPPGRAMGTGNGGTKQCQPICREENEKYFTVQNICVNTCPTGTTQTTVFDVEVCEPICAANKYLLDKNNKCVAQCPQGWVESTSSDGIRLCKLVFCNGSKKLWTHLDGRSECVNNCPTNWVSATDESGNAICTSRCQNPNDFLFFVPTIYSPQLDRCVNTCPGGTRLTTINELQSCKTLCPDKYLWAENNNKCVNACSDGWTGTTNNNGLKFCTIKCTGDQPIWYRQMKSCVSTCPAGWTVTDENTRLRCAKS